MSKARRTQRRKQEIIAPCAKVISVSVMEENTGAEVTSEAGKPSGANRRWVHAGMVALLAVLCFGLYGWTLDFPMVFDDHTYMLNNPFFVEAGTLGYLKDFHEFANRPASIGSDPDYAVNSILRPVAYMSFYGNYLWDGFNPRWFRAVNIVIHALNAMLLYALVTTLLGRFVSDRRLAKGSVVFIAGVAALLFVAHPLAVESVPTSFSALPRWWCCFRFCHCGCTFCRFLPVRV
ncbi:MAG: hypothetical protein U1F71_01325 [Verrucomicrobiaceae bacterium]